MDVQLLSLLFLVLFESCLANNSTTGTTPTDSAYTAAYTAPAPTVPLTTAEVDEICKIASQEPLCPHTGRDSEQCVSFAKVVNGSNPTCVAKNICAFTRIPVENGNSTTNGTTVTSTTPSTTTQTTTTPTTTAHSNITEPPPEVVTPMSNTVYISRTPLSRNVITLKVCPDNKKSFVYPSPPPDIEDLSTPPPHTG